MLKSSYSVIKTDRVEETSLFYEKYFGFERSFSSEWYISLRNGSVELAILDLNHDTIPEKFKGKSSSQSVILNFETDLVDEIYAAFKRDQKTIYLEIRDEEFGQRHFIAEDPNGIPVDVIKVIPPSEEFLKQYT